MKTVFNYLKKNDFPVDYINHFKKNFILETRKTINKEQEQEEKEEKSEFDINKNF